MRTCGFRLISSILSTIISQKKNVTVGRISDDRWSEKLCASMGNRTPAPRNPGKHHITRLDTWPLSYLPPPPFPQGESMSSCISSSEITLVTKCNSGLIQTEKFCASMGNQTPVHQIPGEATEDTQMSAITFIKFGKIEVNESCNWPPSVTVCRISDY